MKTVGYMLAVFAGVSRAIGMCLYRNKRKTLCPLKVVFWHAILTTIVSGVCHFAIPPENVVSNCTSDDNVGVRVNVSMSEEGVYRIHHHSSLLLEKLDSISNVNSALAVFAVIGVCFTATVGTYSSNAAVKYAPASLTSVAQNSDLPVSITERW